MDSITGTWNVVKYEIITVDNNGKNKCVLPFGQNIYGIVIYQDNGYMSGIVSGANRPPVSSPATFGLSDSDKIAIGNNFISYAGKYMTTENTLIHYIKASYIPNLVKETPHTHSFFRSNDMLTIVSEPNISGRNIKVELTLKKIT